MPMSNLLWLIADLIHFNYWCNLEGARVQKQTVHTKNNVSSIELIFKFFLAKCAVLY